MPSRPLPPSQTENGAPSASQGPSTKGRPGRAIGSGQYAALAAGLLATWRPVAVIRDTQYQSLYSECLRQGFSLHVVRREGRQVWVRYGKPVVPSGERAWYPPSKTKNGAPGAR